MRNRNQLKSLIILVAASVLVGCTSVQTEYAKSHGYEWIQINGSQIISGVSGPGSKYYYCRPEPPDAGSGPGITVTCVSKINNASPESDTRNGIAGVAGLSLRPVHHSASRATAPASGASATYQSAPATADNPDPYYYRRVMVDGLEVFCVIPTSTNQRLHPPSNQWLCATRPQIDVAARQFDAGRFP